jgi:uncharacterized protein
MADRGGRALASLRFLFFVPLPTRLASPSMTMLRRSLRIEVRAGEAGKPVRIIASTDAPVERWGYVEILDHNPAAVVRAAVSLLKNHNPDVVVGRILSSDVIDGRIECEVEFAPTPAGREEEVLVRGGFIAGASVGYSIEEVVQTERADGMIEVRATRWTWRELSTTPIPADLNAGIARAEGDNAAWLAALNLPDRRSFTKPAAPAAPSEPVAMTTPATTPTPDANARAALHLDLFKVARSHGVELADADLDAISTREAGLALVLERKSSEVSKPLPVGAPVVTVVRDGDEKIVDEALDAIAAGRRITDAARHYARRRNLAELGGSDDILEAVRNGLRSLDTRGLITADGKLDYRAAFISSDFGSITQLAAAKAMHDGYKGYMPEYPKWCREYFVPDFNTVTISGLGLSELAVAADERSAYADNSIEISGGSGANEFLGTNIDVSLVSLYNDRAGIILDSFRDIGRTGARTLDKISQVALAAASFASATQVLAFSEANLGTVYGAHAAVTIPGIAGRRLIVPMPLYVGARNAVTPANGATAGRILAGSDAIEVVKGWYLTDTNDWYLVADPADAPVVALLRHPDYQAPRLVAKGESGAATTGIRVDFPAKAIVLTKAAGKPLCGYKATQP